MNHPSDCGLSHADSQLRQPLHGAEQGKLIHPTETLPLLVPQFRQLSGAIIFALRETQAAYFLVFAFSSAVRLATLPLLARLQSPKPTLRVLNLEHQTSSDELSPRKLAA